MITQNIDNYDAELIKASKILNKEPPLPEGTTTFAFTPYLMEMHGNVRYMHCSDEDKECSLTFFKAPELYEVHDPKSHVPKCTSCGAPMKPHCMFFDESYSEHYYRDQTMRNLEPSADLLIVIGTALATGGARGLVNRFLNKQEIPVIEINMEPAVDEGFALQITEKSETSLEKLFREYHRLSSTETKAQTKPSPAATIQGKPQVKPQQVAAKQPAPMKSAAKPSAKPVVKK